MKPKTTTIIYWIVTILFCLANLASGIGGLFPNEQGFGVLKQLGYPAYLLFIVSIAKILGSITIIRTKFKIIREWAYAGFALIILVLRYLFTKILGFSIIGIWSAIILGNILSSTAGYFWSRNALNNIDLKQVPVHHMAS